MRIKLILIIAGFSQLAAQGMISDSLFVSASRMMNLEQYQDAVRQYEQIIFQGDEHPDLYYNLGNAYYRLGIYGQAIWAFEKALQFAPRDPDFKFNLEMANTRIRDRINVPDTFFLLDNYRALKKMMTLHDTILIGSALLFLAAFLFWIQRIGRKRIPGFSQIIGSIIVLTVAIHGIALDKYWELSDKRIGIIIAREVEAFSAPFDRKDGVLFKIHEGIKAEIIQSQPEWFEIILLDGKKGWVRAGTVREL